MTEHFSLVEMHKDWMNAIDADWASVIRKTDVYKNVLKEYRKLGLYESDASKRMKRERKLMKFQKALENIETSCFQKIENYEMSPVGEIPHKITYDAAYTNILRDAGTEYVKVMKDRKLYTDAINEKVSRSFEDFDVLNIFCEYATVKRSIVDDAESHRLIHGPVSNNIERLISFIDFQLTEEWTQQVVVGKNKIPVIDIIENMYRVRF